MKMKALSVNAQEFVPLNWLNQSNKQKQQNNVNIEINQQTSTNYGLMNNPYNQNYNSIPPTTYTPIR